MADPKPEIIEVEREHVSGAGNSSSQEWNNGVISKDHSGFNHLEDGQIDGLSAEHRDFLLKRHGTTELNPLPTMDPADPLNWASWKKNVNLLLISFHAMITTFTAAAVIPAFEQFAIDFDISLTQASYITSVQIVVLGFAPLFWKPISNRFGRRPIWLISTFCSMVINIGCGESHSYAAQIATRLLDAFFISPAIAISSAVVTETFFAEERGQKMGIWTLMVTLGPPAGPFIMGFVTQRVGWQWIYYTLAITNFVQFVLYFFFSPETLYVRSQHSSYLSKTASQPQGSAFRRQYLHFGKIGPHPLTWKSFLTPLTMFAYPNVLIPTVAYSIVFNFSSVLLTVEIPQLFTPKFHFNAQQIGLQFIGMIAGSLLGEIAGGKGSDWLMQYGSRRLGRSRHAAPEFRIWLAYPGYATIIAGFLVFWIRLEQLKTYDVTPIIGIGISAFGNQLLTTVLVTYAVDCHHEHAASIGVFINLVRSTWGFIGPFWFPTMFASLGLIPSGGLMVGLIVATALLPTMYIQWKGAAIRAKRSQNELDAVNTITR